MLKTLDPLLGPDLLHALASMGHGDDRLYGNVLLRKGVLRPSGTGS